jgi:hypothetical protein
MGGGAKHTRPNPTSGLSFVSRDIEEHTVSFSVLEKKKHCSREGFSKDVMRCFWQVFLMGGGAKHPHPNPTRSTRAQILPQGYHLSPGTSKNIPYRVQCWKRKSIAAGKVLVKTLCAVFSGFFNGWGREAPAPKSYLRLIICPQDIEEHTISFSVSEKKKHGTWTLFSDHNTFARIISSARP